MSRSVQFRSVDPRALSDVDRDRLIQEIFAVHAEVFDVAEDDHALFVKYVFDSPAQVTDIHVLRDGAGSVVGYAAIHFYEKRVDGRDVTVVRIESGVKRSHRSGLLVARHLVKSYLSYRARHLSREMYFMACPVHPASYAAVAARVPRYWPRHDQPTPAPVLTLMGALADAFEMPRVPDAHPLVRHVGWITRQTDVERAYWRNVDKPSARFYVDANPGFVVGAGLLLFVPLTNFDVVKALWGLVAERASTQVRRAKIKVEQRSQGRVLPASERVAILSEVPLFRELSPSVHRRLAEEARSITFVPGQWVFHQNDRADAMYVVTRGSAYVLQERAADGLGASEPALLDQLSAGDVFGGMAVITGQARSAGVRAVTELSLLRLDMAAVEAAVSEDPASAALLWTNVAKYRFDSFVRDFSELAHMSRRHRLSWFDNGQPSEPGDRAGDGWLFLFHGTARVLVDGHQWSLSAPALVPAYLGADLVAGVGARAWSLPPTPGEDAVVPSMAFHRRPAQPPGADTER